MAVSVEKKILVGVCQGILGSIVEDFSRENCRGEIVGRHANYFWVKFLMKSFMQLLESLHLFSWLLIKIPWKIHGGISGKIQADYLAKSLEESLNEFLEEFLEEVPGEFFMDSL